MARGSIIKRSSGNYAIVYYVDGKTMGDHRPEPPRSRACAHRSQARGRHRHLARAK